ERALRFGSPAEHMAKFVMSASEADSFGICESSAKLNPRHRQSDTVEDSVNRRLRRHSAQGTGDALPLAAMQCALRQVHDDASHGGFDPSAQLDQPISQRAHLRSLAGRSFGG